MKQDTKQYSETVTSIKTNHSAPIESTPSNRMRNMVEILMLEEATRTGAQLTVADKERKELGPQEILLLDFNYFKDNPDAQELINDNFDGKNVVLKKDALLDAWRKGLVYCEATPCAGLLIFMYGKGFFNAIFRWLSHLKIITVLNGHYNNRIAGEKKILNFIKNILHVDIGTSNISQINNRFKHKFGKGIDEFMTINDIFSRLYNKEYLQQKIDNAGTKKGDIIASVTSRVRFYENVNIDEDFNLANKNIGGHVNSFNVRRLLGGHNKDDGKSIVNGQFKQTMDNYLAELGNVGNAQNNRKLALREKIATLRNSALLHGLAHYVEGSTMVVNRLAPIDYHNFHFPFSSGKILTKMEMADRLAEKMEQLSLDPTVKESYSYAIKTVKEHNVNSVDKDSPTVRIDGKYISVNTHAITSEALDYNPLVDNVREVLFIETDEYGIIPYVIIGATMVASITLKIKAGESLKMGDEMGHFGFGASSVIMFVPRDKAVPYEHTRKLQKIYYEVAGNTSIKDFREMEVYIPIGTPLFHPQ